MNFDLTPGQLAVKARAAAFVDEVCKPLEDDWAHDDYDVPVELLFDVSKKFREYGLRGLSIPKELGGLGEGTIAKCLVQEEVQRSHVTHGNMVTYTGMLEPCSALYTAPEWQKEKYLYPLLQEEKFFHIHISEPDFGSDAAAIQMSAVKEGDQYILNGTKRWAATPTHPIVTPLYALCYAVTTPGKGYEGISVFMVDYPNPGISIGEEFRTLASGCLSRSCDLHYKDVAVPAANMLGSEGNGFRVMMDQLNRNRVAIGANYLGKAAWAQARAIERAHERKTFGQPLANRQAIQWMIADSEIEIEQLRSLIYRAAWLVDEGRDARKEVAMVKYVAPIVAGNVADRSIQIHGAMGLTTHARLIQIAGDARVGRVAEGATEMMKMTIARAALSRGEGQRLE